MTSPADPAPAAPRAGDVGLVVSTIGRPALRELLHSAAASTRPPVAVAVANQSGRALDLDPGAYPFPVHVLPSTGGVSAGRNAAAAALPAAARVLAFPNDDSRFPPEALAAVSALFEAADAPAAVAAALRDRAATRFALPPDGTPLDRATVWRAIEPATFVAREAFDAVGGFRVDLGTGGPTPWQSGEGTDLLLRVMQAGGRVQSAPAVEVTGPGERRDLSDDDLVAKHLRYARGTGYVYRLHPYPPHVRLRVLVAPLVKLTSHDPSLPLSLRLAAARSTGRLEGLLGRTRPARAHRGG